MMCGSVCSGIGAPEVAWRELGWRFSFGAEIDAFPRAVYEHRHPGVPLRHDFTEIQDGDHEPIDLLVGGTPCQSFSVAGLRGGLDDDRGNLALEFLRLARRTRARWLLWENVPGVLSSNEGRDFGAILGGMVELGYGLAYRVLDVQYFGVPQRRRRVFVVGYLGDWRRAAAVLFEREGLRRHPAPRREAGKGVAALTANGVGTCGADDNQGQAGHLIAAGIDGGPHLGHSLTTSRTATGRLDPDGQTFVTHSLRGEGFDASEDGTGRGTPLVPVPFDTTQVTSDKNRSNPKPGDPCHPLAAGAHAPAIAFHGAQDPDVSGEVTHPVGRNQGLETCIAFSAKDHGADAMEELAPTLRAGGHDKSHANAGVMRAVAIQERAVSENLENGPGGKGYQEGTAYTLEARNKVQSVATDMSVRRLTPRECERLQGFPDDFTKVPYRGKPASACPDGPRYKALGNSMAVPVMRWIGERIQAVEDLSDSRTDDSDV